MKRNVVKRVVTLILAVTTLVVPRLSVQAVALIKDVEPVIAEQGFYFVDYDVTGVLNADRADLIRGDEQHFIYLTEIGSSELITEVEVGCEYMLHCYIVNDGEPNDGLENVEVSIGQGDNFDTVELNAIVDYGDREDGTHGLVEFFSQLPVKNRIEDSWVRFFPVGKAKLYNDGGRLNGAQINHKRLFAYTDSAHGVYIGYDDQDGFLPYGKEYACEIRVRVRLEATERENHFWSDPSFEGRYTGKIVDTYGRPVGEE